MVICTRHSLDSQSYVDIKALPIAGYLSLQVHMPASPLGGTGGSDSSAAVMYYAYIISPNVMRPLVARCLRAAACDQLCLLWSSCNTILIALGRCQ